MDLRKSLILLIFVCSCAKLTLGNHGAIFEELGSLIASGPAYMFGINIDTDSHVNTINDLRWKLLEIEFECQSLMTKESGKNDTLKHLKILKQTLRNLDAQLLSQETNLLDYFSSIDMEQSGKPEELKINRTKTGFYSRKVSDLLIYPYTAKKMNIFQTYKGKTGLNRRGKRAYIDAGGMILRSVFGTATMDDINELTEYIGVLERNQKIEGDMVNGHTLLINASIYEIVEIKNHLETLDRELTEIGEHVQNFYSVYQVGIFITYLNILSQNFLSAAEAISFRVMRLKGALEKATDGVLDTYLFTPAFCLNFLKQVETTIGRSLPWTVNMKNLPNYYSIVRTFVLKSGKYKARVIVLLPLRALKVDMRLYQVSHLPVATSVNNIFINIKPGYEYLAVSSDRLYYLPLTNLDACLQTRESIICSPSSIIQTSVSKECIVELFIGSDIVKDVCEYTVSTHFRSTFKRISDSYYYSVPKPTILHLDCPNSELKMSDKTYTLNSSGTIKFPQGCS